MVDQTAEASARIRSRTADLPIADLKGLVIGLPVSSFRMKPLYGKIGLTGSAVNGLAMTKNTALLLPSMPRRAGIPALGMTALTLVFASPVHAEGVKAGTVINNSATATYPEGGSQATITSNTVSIRVDEILDVAVAARETADVATKAGSSAQVLAFTVTNKGNGEESFALGAVGTVTGNAFDPTITQIAIDTNGNGQYEPGVDAVVAAGGATPLLAPESGVIRSRRFQSNAVISLA